MKRIRNLFIVLGVMVALLPLFLFYTQHTYYGIYFSLVTTVSTVLLFIIAALVQISLNKKEGRSITFPLIFIGGFIFLLIYLLFIYI
ncbi:hypothetical protein [Aminipila terrae]|uniref:Uncharacterized protein n=1 Tax=Aminipila terrae TaxID=2697030 RepID=A0A6P1MPL3_9FIRM|nr:hypothetical protein [Aminipila terrae]QHI72935.1 hypothetical protein Ami3637_11450 [Aminipila terrae]